MPQRRTDAGMQSDFLDLSLAGSSGTFKRRRRAAQHDHCSMLSCNELGDRPGMIARFVVLLVRGLVLFIEHHQTEMLNWREEGGTRSDDHFALSPGNSMPGYQTVLWRDFRVKNDRIIGKSGRYSLNELGCQRDFRSKYQYRLALPQAPSGGTQIEFGFAAAGHTAKQNWRGIVIDEHWLNHVPRSLLFRSQFRRSIGRSFRETGEKR